MTTIGIKRGTHVFVSDHAIARFQERFGTLVQTPKPADAAAIMLGIIGGAMPYGAQCGDSEFLMLGSIRPTDTEIVFCCHRSRCGKVTVRTVLLRDEADANMQQQGLHKMRRR